MKIIAIDPGGTTGYCEGVFTTNLFMKVYLPDQDKLAPTGIFIRPFQNVDDVATLWDRLAALKPRYIIMEEFEYRNNARAGLDLTPKELIGVAKLYELKAQHQTALYMQKASQGKSYYSDKILKSHELYKRGIPHAMDATRHLLHWLTFGAGFQFLGSNRVDSFVKLLED